MTGNTKCFWASFDEASQGAYDGPRLPTVALASRSGPRPSPVDPEQHSLVQENGLPLRLRGKDPAEPMVQEQSTALPRRSRGSQLVINVITNYGYYVIGMGVMFLLTPFLKDQLGREVCGDWYFLVGLTMYFSLADAGFNAATVKFVAQHMARNEWDAAGQIMAASFRFFLVLALAFAAIGSATLLFPEWLGFPTVVTGLLKRVSASTGTTVLAIIFFHWATEMAFAPFNAALFGAQRYDLARVVAIVARLARFAAILILVSLGYGVVVLALVTGGEALLRGSLQYLLVRRNLPQLPLTVRGAQRSTYTMFVAFSAWILISNLSYKMLMVTDNVLVQITRQQSEVVLYNAVMSPIVAMEQMLWAIAQVLVPFAAAGAALADRDSVHQAILRGARVSLLLALPMVFYLMVAGRGFFGAWMYNPERPEGFPLAHVTAAHHLILLLAPAFLLLFIQQPAIAVLIGTGRVRVPAIINLGQGLTKIVLSVLLVSSLGLTGIALGTVVPLVIANLILLPWFIRRVFGIDWRERFHNVILPGLKCLIVGGPAAWGWIWLTGANAPPTWRLRYQIGIALGVAAIFWIAAWFAGLSREDRAWVRAHLPRKKH